MTESRPHGHLPRLLPEYYRGFAVVHWVMTIESRATGWVDDLFHARWREAMLHTLVRYDLLCPVYCLMPDHVHFVWAGCSPVADQKLAAKFFRRCTNPFLSPHQWQKEPFDHVLREGECERGALRSACQYVRENPVRKNLVENADHFAFSSAVVPGFPDLSPRRADFWEVFWKIYNRRVDGPIAAP